MGNVKWIVGCNVPGYLPESDPLEIDGCDFDYAKRALIEEMLGYAEMVHYELHRADQADEISNAAEDVNLWSESDQALSFGEQGVHAGGWYWWIATPQDDDE